MLTTQQIQQILDAQNSANYTLLLQLCDKFLSQQNDNNNNNNNNKAKAFLFHAKGIALYFLNFGEDAICALQQAANLSPDDEQILSNFAMILTRGSNKTADWLKAKQILENLYAQNHNQNNAVIICRLAVVFWRFGLWQQAKNFSQIVVENHQNLKNINQNDYAEMLSCLSQSYIKLKDFENAKIIIQQLLQQFPNADGHLRYGELLSQTNQKIAALAEFEKSCNLQPQNLQAWDALISLLHDIGETETAYKILENFLPQVPKNQYLYHFAKHLLIDHYCDFMTTEMVHKNATALAKMISEQYPPMFSAEQFRKRKKNKNTLKIGLVSGDLRDHAVAKFLLNLFKALRQRQKDNKALINIEFFAYPTNKIYDEISQEIRSFCKVWSPICDFNDEQAAKKIFADKVDILFDLSGHTADHRLYMFALKPAPIQISWIGWLGTTGIPTMDYFLADEFCVPFGEKYEKQFCEKVLRMPHIWEVLTPPDFPREIQKNFCESRGNENENFIFASFNNPNKVNAKTLDIWCEVLRKSPENTEFIWYRGDFVEKDLQEKFLTEFAKRGVNKNQIFLEKYESYQKYLQKISNVDLILDSVQFSGMTTTAEALSLGTPTITLLGDLMPSRLSGSCINAIGEANLNKNFIFDNENDFVNQAIFFAENPEKLDELKINLAEKARKSPLCDAELFAKNFEIKMWEVWQKFLKE